MTDDYSWLLDKVKYFAKYGTTENAGVALIFKGILSELNERQQIRQKELSDLMRKYGELKGQNL